MEEGKRRQQAERDRQYQERLKQEEERARKLEAVAAEAERLQRLELVVLCSEARLFFSRVNDFFFAGSMRKVNTKTTSCPRRRLSNVAGMLTGVTRKKSGCGWPNRQLQNENGFEGLCLISLFVRPVTEGF